MTPKRAVVIGSGPNGLAGAIALAQAGLEVDLFEANATLGGGVRSAELTLPGFVHDVCSAIHPLGRASPFFRRLDLPVEWVYPPAQAAHPFEDGTAVTLERSVEATADQLGSDARAYSELVGPLAREWSSIEPLLVGPHPPSPQSAGRAARALGPARLAQAARVALAAARPVAESLFRTERARGFFAGHAAHSMLPLERRPSAGFGLALATLGHAVGWPFPRGGSGRLADGLVAHLVRLGGRVHHSSPVDELPRADVVLADVGPRELLRLGRGRFPRRYARALAGYRYGPGVFKLDWALSGPIPWLAAGCRRAATVHLGGTLEEIAASETAARAGGDVPPFVILAQPSLFDDTRAPLDHHTAWAYCHVRNGSTVDMSVAIEAQVERFAPGFGGLILARSVLTPADLEAGNRNYVGGDINTGAMDVSQLFFRPVRRAVPYRTPLKGVYICSAATPPGGGVHGMCGFSAARLALRDL